MAHASERRKLDLAIVELRKAIRELVDVSPGQELSLLDQLRFSINNKIGSMAEGYTAHSRKRLLINATALDLYRRIESEFGKWPGVALRIMYLDCLKWNDLTFVALKTSQVRRFVVDIAELMDPPRRFHLRDGKGNAAACPKCHKRIAYREDLSGERIQVPTLSVHLKDGCTCLNCGEHWPASHFEFLARVLQPGA